MSRLLSSLLDPGTFVERYGARGFCGLVAFAALTEAAYRWVLS